jgi:hypothetical protein
LLARAEARVSFGNVIYNLGELFQRLVKIASTPCEKDVSTSEVASSDSLCEATQALLTRTRQLTLYNAAGEPDVDRPYNQDIMEAIGASIQRLMDLVVGTIDSTAIIKSKEDNFQVWLAIRDTFAQDRDEFIRSTSVYLNMLSACLMTKQPLPAYEISPRKACLTLMEALRAGAVIETNKVINLGFTEAQMMESILTFNWAMASWAAAMNELILLEELLGRMLGRSEWLIGTSDRLVSSDPTNHDELGLLQDLASSGVGVMRPDD